MLCGTLPLVYGCSNEDALTEFDGSPTVAVHFGIAGTGAGVASRAMSDSEDEDELTGECAINNVLFLIYDAPLNSGEPGTIVKTAYLARTQDANNKIIDIPEDDDNPYNPNAYHDVTYYPYVNATNKTSVGSVRTIREYKTEFKATDLETGKRYYAIALVNFGQSFDTFRGKSLDYLRNYIYKGELYTVGNSGVLSNTEFRMSAINEVSFLYEKQETFTITDIFLVQRLASRVDLAFGTKSATYDGLNAKTDGAYTSDFHLDMSDDKTFGGSAVFPVYVTENGTTTRSETSRFFMTDVQVVDSRSQTSTGLYLLERSSSTPTGAPTYLGNEGWTDYNNTTQKYEYASRYVQSPSSPTYNAPYSLMSVFSYTNMRDLIFGGNISTTHSVVGYFTESTNDDEATQPSIRICGWTNASTSGMFAGAPARNGASRDNPTKPSWLPDGGNGYTYVTADIPIRHNIRPAVPTHSSYPLEYAMVRNTIYRIYIKVYAVENKIYFRYYYYDDPSKKGDDDMHQNDYTATGFASQIGDGFTGTPTD